MLVYENSWIIEMHGATIKVDSKYQSQTLNSEHTINVMTGKIFG
jgi:hypothetical protein